MTYHPLLEDLAKWENEEHFYAVRYNWWSQWPRFDNAPITPALLEKDEFKIPTDMVDFKTGETIYEISTFSFLQNLGIQMENEFKELYNAIQEKSFALETENQKKSLILFLLNETKTVRGKFLHLGIKNRYKEVLINEFQKGEDYLEKLLPSEITKPSNDWNFKYDYLNRDGGKENLRIVVADLKKEGFIGQETPLRLFTRLFSGDATAPKKKIVWTGRKGELTFFISKLANSKFMTTNNHWVAVENYFEIFSAGKEFSTSKLNTADKTTSKKQIEILSKIILELE